MKQGKAKYLFPGNNTPNGFTSHYADALKGLSHVFILKGGPGVGKSTLMRKIGIAMLERGYDVEFWQCSSDNDSIDGVMIPNISTAIVDGTPPHSVDPRYPGAVEEIIDLGAHWNRTMLKNDKSDIVDITDNISEHFAACYGCLSAAGKELSDTTNKAAATIKQGALQKLSHELAADIFKPKPNSRHLFSTAITPRGVISFGEPLSRLAGKRWLLVGPSGCGKERLLQLLADEAEKKGHFAEVYHPALLPENIELLLLPYLNCAILDAGVDVPAYASENDTIIDCSTLFDFCWDEQMQENINTQVEAAIAEVAQAKELHDQLEKHYIKAMDFEGVDAAGAALFNRILTLCADSEAGNI